MYTESVLLESRTLRSGMTRRVEILDKVEALSLAPDGVHATTKDVAAYFEVTESAVNNLLDRHREELESSGLRVLRGADLRDYQTLNMRLSEANAKSYPQQRHGLAVYTRRTVLNVAMLLRDCAVARRVRSHLLDVEERARAVPEPAAPSAAPAVRHSRLESAVAGLGPVLQELGPVIHRMSVRVDRIDRRVSQMDRRAANTEEIVCAMSTRMADLAEELRGMRTALHPDVPRDPEPGSPPR